MDASDGVNCFIELLEEAGAVLLPEGRRTAGDFARFAQFREEPPGGHHLADVVLGEGPAGGASSGMSADITMSPSSTMSAIQSSAASRPSPTTSRRTFPSPGMRIREFATTVTSRS